MHGLMILLFTLGSLIKGNEEIRIVFAGDAMQHSAQIEAANKFAYNLGIAFQIKDDILDVIGDSEVLGKPVGSDAENDKTTYVTLKGIESSQKDVENYTDAAVSALSLFENTEFLELLAGKLTRRVK